MESLFSVVCTGLRSTFCTVTDPLLYQPST